MASARKHGKSVKDVPIGPTETGDVKTTSTGEVKTIFPVNVKTRSIGDVKTRSSGAAKTKTSGALKTGSTSESTGSAPSTQHQPPTGNRNTGIGAGALNIGDRAGGINGNKGKIKLKAGAAGCEVPKDGNANAGPGAGAVNRGIGAGGVNDNEGEIDMEC